MIRNTTIYGFIMIKNIFLLFLFVFSFSNIFSMNSVMQWSSGFAGIAMMLYGYSTEAENNGYNKKLDVFKTQFKTAWSKKEAVPVQIGNDVRNNYNFQDLVDQGITGQKIYQERLINLFAWAIHKETKTEFPVLPNELNSNKLERIRPKSIMLSGQKYYKGGKSLEKTRALVCLNTDDNHTETLKELELVKNQIIMPLFENKKNQIPAYVVGASGLILFVFSVFYKKIFSLK